jgi:hypothetical protein
MPITTNDPCEQKCAAALDAAGIRYEYDTERQQKTGQPALDFYLPDLDVHIEVK